MSAHTPGPWRVHDLYPRVVVTEKDDEMNLLHIDYTLGGDGVASAPTAADARLIAAAPDLLAALKGVRGELASEDCNWCGARNEKCSCKDGQWFRDVVAAIAKATT